MVKPWATSGIATKVAVWMTLLAGRNQRAKAPRHRSVTERLHVILPLTLVSCFNSFSEAPSVDTLEEHRDEFHSICLMESPGPLLAVLDNLAKGVLGAPALAPGEEALASFPSVPQWVFRGHYRAVDSLTGGYILLTSEEEIMDGYRLYYAAETLQKIAPFELLKWLSNRARVHSAKKIDVAFYLLLASPGNGIMIENMRKGTSPSWPGQAKASWRALMEGDNRLLRILAVMLVPYADLQEEEAREACLEILQGEGSVMHYYALKALERLPDARTAQAVQAFIDRLPENGNDGSLEFIEHCPNMRTEAEDVLTKIRQKMLTEAPTQ